MQLTMSHTTLAGIAAMDLAEAMQTRLTSELVLMGTQMLEKLQKTLAHSLLTVRSRMNQLVLINNFPPEVLGMIFQLVPSYPYNKDDCEYPANRMWNSAVIDPVTAMPLLQVCRQWRQVALALPAIWSNINGSRRLPPDSLRRSTPTQPLKVFAEGLRHDHRIHMINLLHSDGSRFQELHWDGVDIRTLVDNFSFTAPKLEDLALRVSGDIRRVESPFTIFNGQTPRLRRLWLKSFPSLPENNFPNLTCLCILGCAGDNFLSRILSMLSASPNLVDFVLSGPSKALEQDNPSEGIVNLSHLQRLVLHNVSNIAAHTILSHVTVSTDTAVMMHYSGWYPRMDCDGLTRLPVMQSLTRLRVALWAKKLHIKAVGASAGVFLSAYALPRGGVPGEQLYTLPEVVPLAQLQELWVLDEDAVTQLYWRFNSSILYEWLLEMPKLERLVVYDRSVALVIQALTWAHNRRICPNFSSLHILLQNDRQARSALDALATKQGEHGIRHLTLGYLPGYVGDPVDEPEFDAHFETVHYEDFEETPSMQMPSVCTTTAHPFWRSWR